MTENAGITNDADAAAQRASEQARLRKERREAKLKAGGSARLDKITGMSGRPKTDFDAPPQTNAEADLDKATAAAAAASQAPAPSATDGDPEEVDISTSEHFYKPNTTARSQRNAPSPAAGQEPQMSEDALRQMMMGFDPAGAQGGQGMPNPFGGAPGANGEEDPIMKMMSQMMGGAGGPGGSPFPGMNGMPDLSNLTGQAAQKPVDFYTALWRLLHAIVAIGLGLYITTLTPFTGTKVERDHASLAEIKEHEHEKQMFFWVFATAEACLLTTRFFLDKGRAPPGGIVWTVIGFLPEPFKGYVEVMARSLPLAEGVIPTLQNHTHTEYLMEAVITEER